MDSRTAAHVLSQISALVELQGGNRFKARAYQSAAKAISVSTAMISLRSTAAVS